MLLPDVNVLVFARSEEAPEHSVCRDWLQDALNGSETVGLSELILSGVVRVLTNHRAVRRPERPDEALAYCAELLSAPSATALRPGPRHWRIFTAMCDAVGARANVVPDAYHAALALEHGATFVTNDRGFHRFPGLRVLSPMD